MVNRVVMKNLLTILALFLTLAGYSQVNIDGNLMKFSKDSGQRIQPGYRPYLDQLCDISTSLSPTPAWTLENYCSTGIPIVFMRHDQDDQIQIKIQFNHNKALGAPLADVHMHCIPMGSVTGDVRFCIYYKWINYGEVLPIDTAVGAGTWTRTFVNLPIAGTDQYKEGVCVLLTNVAAPANETPSSILHIIAVRKSSSALDSYTSNKTCGGTNAANFGIVYVDAHYPVSKLGSKTSISD